MKVTRISKSTGVSFWTCHRSIIRWRQRQHICMYTPCHRSSLIWIFSQSPEITVQTQLLPSVNANATKVKIILLQETQTLPFQSQESLILKLIKQASVYQYMKLDRHQKKRNHVNQILSHIVSLITPLYF